MAPSVRILTVPEGEYDIVFVDGGEAGFLSPDGLMIHGPVKDKFRIEAGRALEPLKVAADLHSVNVAMTTYIDAVRMLISDARVVARTLV